MLAAFALVAGAAGPAAATPDAGVFQGSATVGKTFRNVNTGATSGTLCMEQDAHKIIAWGTGLFLPQMNNGRKNGTWQFKTAVISAGNPAQLGSHHQLDACGFLRDVHLGDPAKVPTTKKDSAKVGSGIGAACGASKGQGGVGKIRLNMAGTDLSSKTVKQNFAGQIIRLKNIQWKTSAGGTLPVTAEAQFASITAGKPHNKTNKPKTGTLVAEVQAQGGQACLDAKTTEKKTNTGARSFTVVGVYELLQP